jgi:hypothetical protein
MRCLLLILSMGLCSVTGFADEDLFIDGNADNAPAPEISIEYDPHFEDDFLDIEKQAVLDLSASAAVVPVYDLWNTTDIVRHEKSLSVLSGGENIASIYHLMIFPQAHFQFWKIIGHVGAPLRFPIYDNAKRDSPGERAKGFLSARQVFLPRARDFRSFWDTHRLIRHFELTHELFNLKLSRNAALTMGHGELLKSMATDGFYDQDYLFFAGRLSLEKVSVDAMVGPLLKPEMVGFSSRFAPLYQVNTKPFVRDLNFDVTYVNDFFAPNITVLDGDNYVLDADRRLIKRKTGTAQGLVLGVSGLYNATSFLSLTPYISYGHLWLTGLKDRARDLPMSYGGGLHVGHDSVISFIPGTKKSLLVLKTEGRLFSRGYWPGYFGSTYLIDRVVLPEPQKGVAPVSKSEFLLDKNDGRFRVGYLVELVYAYENLISSSVGYESAHSFMSGVQIPHMRKFHFGTTFYGLDIFKFHVSFQATSIAQMKELFDFEKSRALLSLRGQLKVLPFLYFDTWVKHAFGINDMFNKAANESESEVWMTNLTESKSLNFGLGAEFAMTF